MTTSPCYLVRLLLHPGDLGDVFDPLHSPYQLGTYGIITQVENLLEKNKSFI
jgi:hypothetical protein